MASLPPQKPPPQSWAIVVGVLIILWFFSIVTYAVVQVLG